MRRCPLSYEPIPDGDVGPYSRAGLRLLSRTLSSLERLPFTSAELRREASARATKMSIQGVQPKLSARLAVSRGRFELVDRGGTFVLKPQSADYLHVPENEDLTMRLAAAAGIEVPVHGLVLGKDGAFTYVVRRFDRVGRGRKLAVEDFAQLDGRTRETKYEASMERVASVVERYATFPAVERLELLRRAVFCFLTGNEDMHLKNFSLIEREGKRTFAPAYDMVNTTLALPRSAEEFALPVNGKKRKITRDDLVEYFALDRLRLPATAVDPVFERMSRAADGWAETIAASFLPDDMKARYEEIVEERRGRLRV